MKRLLPALLPIAGFALSACAAGDVPPATVDGGRGERACFIPDTVRNFRAASDAQVYVRAGRGQVYELNSGFCRGMSSARSIALTAGPGGGRACVGDSVEIAVSGPGLQGENDTRCRARVERRLTEGEIAALEPRLRP
ncbi:DUF6491 family protein [Brevundimonas fluminis]|jgi:hypothetical protein|uniref:DUF6491 family protein n=1 Tax=Brevundimonas fluminis TaxID=2487274 RepID=UPI000F656915|nr:DUF6491 family protein [Brevundimonas fluminis]